jgi:hypothetical protein
MKAIENLSMRKNTIRKSTLNTHKVSNTTPYESHHKQKIYVIKDSTQL